MLRRKVRRAKAVEASVGDQLAPLDQLALPIVLEEVPQPDLSSGTSVEPATLRVERGVARLATSKVCWNIDLRPGTVLPVPVAHALAMGARATPVAPSVQKAAPNASLEHGFAGEDLHEYFVKSDALNGILHMKRKKDGSWGASVAKETLPYVLTRAAVKSGAMPAHGTSALPKSLERVVPQEFQYWKAATPEEAGAIRNALVESDFFAPRLVKVVDGDLRLCVEQLFLYEPDASPAAKAAPDSLQTALPQLVPAEVLKSKLRTPLTEDGDWAEALGGDAPEFLVLSARDEAERDAVVAELSKGTVRKHWIAEYSDSASTREALGKLGRLFKVRTHDAQHRCFAASFPCAESVLVEYIDSYPTAKAAPKVAVTKSLNVNFRRRVTKAEERFVIGVVLEPLEAETPDAQNDVYDAETIRKTAHLYMADFRTIGLMHKGSINEKVQILESFIAPCDYEEGEATVKKGSWVLGARVVDDDLWEACKNGELTGWSIGGTANRTPVEEASSPPAAG